MNKKLLIIFSLILCLPIVVSADQEKASYSLVMLPEKITINPGENITIRVYFSGDGDVKSSKLGLYVGGDFDIYGYILANEKPNISKSWIILTPLDFLINERLEMFPSVYLRCSEIGSPFIEKCYDATKERPEFKNPITIKLGNTRFEGDHEIVGVLSYQDMDGDWHTSQFTVKFHVYTWWERIYYSSALIIAISALAISFTSLMVSLFRKSK